MKYLVLVSHGEFAKGLRTSLCMLAGDKEEVIAVGLEDGKTADEFAVAFDKAMDVVQEDDRIILLADIIGGSPLTTALSVLDQKGLLTKTTAIGGMNLPLALTAVLMKDTMDEASLVAAILPEATGAIQQFNTTVEDEEDDI